MKKILTLLPAFAMLIFFSSCKKDEEGPPAEISFNSPASSVIETTGTASVVLVLDRAAAGDITVNFTVEGSAVADEDYTSTGTMTIPSGADEAELNIEILDDDVFEFDLENNVNLLEKIEITLSGVTGNGMLSETAGDVKHTLYIEEDEEEPYIRIDLEWKDMATGDENDVDMDLLFWYEPEPGMNEFQLGPSEFQQGTKIGTEFESLSLSGINPDTNYGLTFLYFEGSATDLEFTVTFTVFGGTLLDGLTTVSYTGNYTDSNINGTAYDDGSFQLVQVYQKEGFNYPTISELEIPTTGSRIKLPKLVLPDAATLRSLKK